MYFITFNNEKKDDFGSQSIKYINKYLEYLNYIKNTGNNNKIKYIHSPCYVLRASNCYESLYQNNKILDDDLVITLNNYLNRKNWRQSDKNNFIEKQRQQKKRALEWDNFLNYSQEHIKIFDINLEEFETFVNFPIDKIDSIKSEKKVLLVNPIFPEKINLKLKKKLLTTYREDLINKYQLTEKPNTDLNKDKINISIHIRRVGESNRMSKNMNVEDELYLKLINTINSYNFDNICINIFTVKENNTFNKSIFESLPNTKLFYRTKDQDKHLVDFHNLVCSDILFIGYSSYSSLAAYYNIKGSIYYNFGKKSDIISCRGSNVFDCQQDYHLLEQKLKTDIQRLTL